MPSLRSSPWILGAPHRGFAAAIFLTRAVSSALTGGRPPAGPDPGQPDPEEAIDRAKLGPRLRPPVHGELVAQGQVLEGELAMAAAEEREKSKQVEQEDDHRAEILSGSAPTDQQLAPPA